MTRKQQSKHAIREVLCRTGATLLANARVGGHESRIECTFGEDCAEMIWQPKGDHKGIGNRPGAEDGPKKNVAEEAAHA